MRAASRSAGEAVARTFASTQGDPNVVTTAQPTRLTATYAGIAPSRRRSASVSPTAAAASVTAISTYTGVMSAGRRRKSPTGQIPTTWSTLSEWMRFPNLSWALSVSPWLAVWKNDCAVTIVGRARTRSRVVKVPARAANDRSDSRRARTSAGNSTSPSQTPPPTLSTPSTAAAATAGSSIALAGTSRRTVVTTSAVSSAISGTVTSSLTEPQSA